MQDDASPAAPAILDYASESSRDPLRNWLSLQLLVAGLGVAVALRITSALLVVAARGAVHTKMELSSVSYGVCYLGWRLDQLPHWMAFGVPVVASVLWARLTSRWPDDRRRLWEERLIAASVGAAVLWLAIAFASVAFIFVCLCQPASKPGVFPW